MPSYVVTGASRGLGYTFITYLAAIPGNIVVGLVRNKHTTLARLAKDNVTNVTILEADITDRTSISAAAAAVSSLINGSLDVLINNAAVVSGRSKFLTLLDDDAATLEEDLSTSFRVNVVGVSNVVHAFLPLLRAGREKKVITISTGMADLDLINHLSIAVAPAYSISKAATNALVAKYHAALGKSEGFLFLTLSPGLVDTSEGKVPTKQQIEGQKAMGELFKSYAPDFKGPISAQESVRMCMEVVERATVEEFGGKFVSHYGDKQWL